MLHFYITKSNTKKITIPFVPPKKMNDKFYLINKIFGSDLSENFVDTYDMIMSAIKYDLAEYWEEAGAMLLRHQEHHYDKWANHCFKVADGIRNRKHKKSKVFIPFYSSEDSSKKFKRLLNGEEIQ